MRTHVKHFSYVPALDTPRHMLIRLCTRSSTLRFRPASISRALFSIHNLILASPLIFILPQSNLQPFRNRSRPTICAWSSEGLRRMRRHLPDERRRRRLPHLQCARSTSPWVTIFGIEPTLRGAHHSEYVHAGSSSFKMSGSLASYAGMHRPSTHHPDPSARTSAVKTGTTTYS